MAKGHNRPRQRRRRSELGVCQDCSAVLTADNWYWFGRARPRHICKTCWIARQAGYRQNESEAIRQGRRDRRNALARSRYARDPFHHRRRMLKHNYGLSVDDYFDMLERQQGKCGICKGRSNGRGDFHVDHCHDTGKVRGLLCAKCNLLLGHADDNTKLLRAAIYYLIDPPNA